MKDLEKEAEEEEQRILQQSIGELAYILFCSLSLWVKKQLSKPLNALVDALSRNWEPGIGGLEWTISLGPQASRTISNLQLLWL